MVDQPQGAPHLDPAADLDAAFTLPDNIEDPRWRELYEVIVTRMRREAQGLPMNTVQALLIERIAYNYIVLRVKEAASGTSQGFAHATAQKEFNTFWLSMTVEFNRLLRTADSDFRAQVVQQVAQVVNASLEVIKDPQVKADVRRRLADELEGMGL